jgi:hypothetical protein
MAVCLTKVIDAANLTEYGPAKECMVQHRDNVFSRTVDPMPTCRAFICVT